MGQKCTIKVRSECAAGRPALADCLTQFRHEAQLPRETLPFASALDGPAGRLTQKCHRDVVNVSCI